jgi:hypothetical protein
MIGSNVERPNVAAKVSLYFGIHRYLGDKVIAGRGRGNVRMLWRGTVVHSICAIMVSMKIMMPLNWHRAWKVRGWSRAVSTSYGVSWHVSELRGSGSVDVMKAFRGF